MKEYIFLVDELTPNNEYGVSYTDTSISHNLKILGEDFYISSEIKGMISDKASIATVIPIGTYATIIIFDRHHTSGIMMFICHNRIIVNDNFKNHLVTEFGNDITNEWLRIYELMQENFVQNDDNVKLHLK